MSHRRVFQIFVCSLLMAVATPLLAQTQNYSDLWWDPSEPGWALTLADHGNLLSGVVYGYGPDAAGTWYLIPAGTFTDSTKRFFNADLYNVSGPAYNVPMDPNAGGIFRAGKITIDFAPPDLDPGTAVFTLSFTGSGTTYTKQIQRYPFGDAPANWGTDSTDLWWSPARPDWGLALAQHGDSVFGIWYSQSGDWGPQWYYFSNPTFNGTSLSTSPLFFARGPNLPTTFFDASGAISTNVGNAALDFSVNPATFAPTVQVGAPVNPQLDGSTQWPIVPLQFGEGLLAVFCASPQIAPAPTILTASPIALSALEWITPLGNMNPEGGHPLPTDHIYFYFADPDEGEDPIGLRTEVVAPGSGVVTSTSSNNDGTPDMGISVQVSSTLSYSLGHVIPDGPIAAGTKLAAGQHIGTTGTAYALDLGVTNLNVTQNLANPSRYADGGITLHSDGPIKYYSGQLQSQLYLKTHRIQPECDGVFNYDVPGTLSGNWFFSNWANLSFAMDTYDPSLVRINVPYGLNLAPFAEGGVMSIASGDTPPSQVTPSSGLVIYTLTSARTGLPAPGAPAGWLLVQMIDSTHVKVEFFGPNNYHNAFDSQALVFTR